MTGEDITSLRVEAIKHQLPTFQSGAHIDVHLQNCLNRQYSLTNSPGETEHYPVGVKREPDSQGRPAAIHDEVKKGDVLASLPRAITFRCAAMLFIRSLPRAAWVSRP